MKLFYRAVTSIRRLYWRVFKPKRTGVKALLIFGDEFIAVKHSYESLYMLPGGAVKRNESPSSAIKREIAEELGIVINNLEEFGLYKNHKEGKRDTIHLFVGKVADNNLIIGTKELENAKWCELKNTEKELSLATKSRIKEYLGETKKSSDW